MARVIDTYELSPLQVGMLFHSVSEGESGVYIWQVIATLREPLDEVHFLRAWQRVAERHPVLRSRFRWEGVAQPVQDVMDQVKIPVERLDWRGIAEAERQRRFQALLDHDRARGFDLGEAPLLRLALVRAGEREYRVVWTYHHVLLDGRSRVLVLREVFAFYEAFSRGKGLGIALPRPYREYIEWLRALDQDSAKLYWQKVLAGFKTPTPLVVGRDRGAGDVTGAHRGSHESRLTAALTAALRERAREASVTLNTLVQGAWALLLHRYSGETDIAFGATRACRRSALGGTDDMVGLFINTLPLRVQVDRDAELVPWLQQLRAQQVSLRDYEHTPLVQVQGWSEVPRGTPLFESILVFENRTFDEQMRALGGAWSERRFRVRGQTGFPLVLNAWGDDELLLQLDYSRRRFADDAVTRMLGHLQTLLEGMAAHPKARLGGLPLLTEAERHQLLVEWNDTKTEYPDDALIHELFEAQAARTPERIAVVHEERELTYGELNARANRLAHYLRTLGVKPDARVAICVERGLDMVVGLLAVLKAGGAYVPLDPMYPAERLSYMLQDSTPVAILTDAQVPASVQAELRSALVGGADAIPVIDLQAAANSWAKQPKSNPKRMRVGLNPAHLAYVIYTSGSTGRPKGVAIEHRNAVNFLYWAQSSFTADQLSRTLFSTSLNFDLAIYECFAPLAVGATTQIVRNALDLGHAPHAVTLINTVPSSINALLDADGVPDTVRTVNLAGEPLKRALVERLFAQTDVDTVCNLYGPSETTTYSTWVAMRREQGFAAHIGRPVANTRIYLLDAHRQPVPVGVAGEMYIGGAGVARGYLNRPELTAERFVADPFANEPNARMYRTGDLARYLPDGTIEFLGRNDFQVKLRGYRIELGEIEAHLTQHPAIREAVVLAREDAPGDKRLVAYVVPEHAAADLAELLRAHLRATLPEYMVPAAFVALEALPLTPNGKVDRAALPAPEASAQLKATYLAPRTPTEEILAGIWAEVLGLERVGINGNFFELGGHSLLATQVVSRVRQALGVELPLRKLFASPTVAGLAGELAGDAAGAVAPPIARQARRGRLPVSFSQQRLWFLDQLQPGSTAFNMPFPMRLRGELDVVALQRSLERLVERHESLRTTFLSEGGKPMQVIAPELRLVVEVEAVDSEQTLQERLKALCAEPFDLARGPLLRVRVLRLSGTEQVLFLMMHHIVSDGWSMGVLFRELAALYGGYRKGEEVRLPPLPVQYADYAVWQREWLQGEELERQVAYWKGQLAGAPPVLELPTDRLRPAVQSYRGAVHTRVLSAGLSERLKSLGRSRQATLFMVMLAAFQVLLARWTGQQDLVVGTPIAGRQHRELEGLIGWFLNALALRTDLSGDPDFVTVLGRVREAALGAYAHQSLPFEKLVEALNPERDMSHAPIIQVMFGLHNEPFETSVALGGLEVRLESLALERTNFDLNVHIFEAEDRLRVSFRYCGDLFLKSTIERLASQYEGLLESIVERPESRISELALLTEAEQAALVREEESRRPQNAYEVFPAPEGAGSLVSRFESQVLAHGDRIAVKTPETAWTYEGLNARANGVARALLTQCAGRAGRIGLVFDQDAPMLAGLLGVLKAGQAYVPLDPRYPLARLAAVIADAGIEVVVTEAGYGELVARLVKPGRLIDVMALEASLENPGVPIAPERLAYILYTSGSTGEPKGVMQTHRNVLHHVGTYTNALHISKQDRLTLLSAYGFDAAVQDIFGALLNGATVYPLNLRREVRVGAVLERISAEKLTILHCTPTVYRYLLRYRGDQDLSSLRAVVLGGEEARGADLELFKAVFDRGAVFVNGLGPTESTLALQFFANHDTQLSGNVLPVGRAVVRTEAVMLHEGGRAAGICGEIAIRSAYLTPGYWARPELTAAAFPEDPAGGERRIYRTGDMGRRLPDGQLAFMGRADRQVKLRGFRIELGEVESVLATHPQVGEAVVVAQEDQSGDKRLVAYVTAVSEEADAAAPRQYLKRRPERNAERTNSERPPTLTGCSLSSEELRRFLREKLPEYMLPSVFVFLDALPLTPSGKVDRKALPAPAAGDGASHTGAVAPRTATEEMVLGVFRGVLERADFGVLDSFFDLGGHSLMAARLMARLRTASGIDLPLRNLFESPTVAGMAEVIDALAWSAQPKAPTDATGDREEIEL
jgi:amino acid adenylation domain-containing protein